MHLGILCTYYLCVSMPNYYVNAKLFAQKRVAIIGGGYKCFFN